MAGEDIKRRLAAIMSADVVGYSRLMGKDEEGTLAALKALREDEFAPKVTAYKVRVPSDGRRDSYSLPISE